MAKVVSTALEQRHASRRNWLCSERYARFRRVLSVLSHESPLTIYAFIGSPGDVAEERVAARDVVERLNRALGRELGVRVEFLGWETTRPGYGRPQEQINADVDACGLFVGLLWQRWGEPTGEAEYSSGFEEEFERALARRRRDGVPEIWIYLKDVDEVRMRDPGPQLTKVLAFRERLRAEKELKYHTFPDVGVWKDTLSEHLAGYVASIARQRVAADDRAPVHDRPEPPAAPEHEDAPAAQAARAHEAAREALSRGEPSAAGREMSAGELARVFLTSATWMAERTGSMLENHEINFVYAARTEVDPLVAEQAQILRAVIGDRWGNKPGWYWLRALAPAELARQTIELARNGHPPEVRVSAIRLLAAAPAIVDDAVEDSEGRLALYQAIATSDSQDVREAAYTFLKDADDDESRHVLEQHAEADAPGSFAARKQLVLRLLRAAPDAAVDRLLEWPLVADGAVTTAVGEAEGLSPAAARRLLDLDDGALVAAALPRASEEMSVDDVRALLADQRAVVRDAAASVLLARGERIDKAIFDEAIKGVSTNPFRRFERETELRRMWLGLQTEEELRADINFYFGPDPYYALSLGHYASFQKQLRRDLADSFQEYRLESLERLRESFGAAAEPVSGKDYVRFLVPMHRAAAVEALAERSTNADDRELGLAALADDDSRVRRAGVRLLRKFGRPEDADAIVGVAARAGFLDADLREEAVLTALELAPGAGGAAQRLIEMNDATMARLVLLHLREDDPVEATRAAIPLFGNRDTAVRRRAVAFISRQVGADALEEILGLVLETEQHFYNVIGWIDRLLYAPEPFRTAYATLADE